MKNLRRSAHNHHFHRIQPLIALCIMHSLFCSAPGRLVWKNPATALGSDFSRPTLFISSPIVDTAYLHYSTIAAAEYTDHQLLVNAAAASLASEISRRFRLIIFDDTTSLQDNRPGFSRLLSRGDSIATAEFIVEAARRSGAQNVAVAHQCSVTTVIFQPQAWRGGKYEGYYERPVTRKVTARIHLQVWTADGRLAYEKIGAGTAKAPILYDQLKTKSKEGTDLVRLARRWYAPPALRSLLSAAKDALSDIR